MADNIRATPQNPYTGALARGLRSLQQLAGQYQVDPRIPLLGGTSVDELLSLPGAASLAEDVSYYGPRALIRGGNVATGGIGTFRLDPRVVDVADVAMNVTPLAAMAGKTATRGAMAAGRAGERLAERVVPQVMERGGIGAQLMQDMATGSRSQVVKPKGGNWLAGSIEREIAPMRTVDPAMMDVLRNADPRFVDQAALNRVNAEGMALDKWLETKLAKYIRNEMGTPEDPLRALAERGITHAEMRPLADYNLDNIEGVRMNAGFPAQGLATTRLGREWEAAADRAIYPSEAGYLTRTKEVETNPFLLKVPPETMVYEVGPRQSQFERLGFSHLADELRNAINPASGLPENLRWKYQDLEKVTVPQAVQRVADINAWRAAQKAEADAARAMNPATHVFKEYPEQGFKWVELKAPKDDVMTRGEYSDPMFDIPEAAQNRIQAQAEREVRRLGLDDESDDYMYAIQDRVQELSQEYAAKNKPLVSKALEDALKYEGETMGHCVGGYCPDVIEGRSRIFSLRDKKGQPHVTIEVAPANIDHGMWYQSQPQEVKDALEAAGYRGYNIRYSPQFKAAQASAPEEIVQIKGKANRAPNPEYLPAVQDFVRSGKWSKVGDLQNTGLISYKGEYRLPEEFLYRTDEGEWEPLVDVAKRAFPDNPAKQLNFYRGASELENDIKLKPQDEGFAEGGLVGGANFPTYDFDPARIDSIVGELHAMNAG